MTRLAGWLLAGGIMLGLASSAQAQIVIGNPYTGPSISIGTGGYSNYGYGVGSPYGYGNYGYGNGYGLAGTQYYSSGYSGLYGAPITRSYTTTTYGYPAYGYGQRYGYSGYGYGRRGGIGRILRRW
jgi:acidic type I keratin